MSRKYRQLVARLLLAAFAFAQAAVSAHACPEMTVPAHAPMSAEAMSDCDTMTRLDPSVPNLCLAHCQVGQQTVDHSAQPGVAPVGILVLVVAEPDLVTPETSRRASSTQRFTAAAPPPHSILHCCFRI